MGQKVNLNALQTNISKPWVSKYIDKNNEELCYFTYEDTKIREYIYNFFAVFNVYIHSCRINRSSYAMKIFITYLSTPSSLRHISKNIRAKVKKRIVRRRRKSRKVYRIKKLEVLNKIKNRKRKTIWLRKKELFYYNNFISKLINGLFLFTRKKIDISLIFQNINKGSSNRFNNTSILRIKKILFKLRYYKKNKFFRESFNIIFIILKKKNSSKLLCDFISYQLSLMKKHNYFITFLRKTLTYFVNLRIFGTRGVRILINGRLNSSSRSRTTLLVIGHITSQTFSSSTSYYHNRSYTLNGTLGVKVWVE